MPKGKPSAREARIRKAASPARAASSPSAGASWVHQALLWVALLTSLLVLTPRVEDSAQPLSYLRSIVIHHDVRLDTGASGGEAVIGRSILWSPFFLAAHVGVEIAQLRGSQVPADGLSWPYVWACAFGTAIYGFLALAMSFRLARRVTASAPALLATLVIWLASSLAVYLYVFPFHSHVAAMFTATLMLTLWLSFRDGKDTRARWLLWGLAGGLACTTSIFNAALLVLPLAEAAKRLTRPRGVMVALEGLFLFLGAAALIAVPFVLVERPPGTFAWNAPGLWAMTFAAERGAFLWTPVLLISAFGYALAMRRQPAFASTLFVIGVLFVYLVAGVNPAPTTTAYGAPSLVAMTPVFVVGLAALVGAMTERGTRVAWAGTASAAAMLILWNLGLMLQWGTGLIPAAGPVDFRQAAINQVTVVPHAARDFVIRYINDRQGRLSGFGGRAHE